MNETRVWGRREGLMRQSAFIWLLGQVASRQWEGLGCFLQQVWQYNGG